jgi:hypothetical protein
VTVMMLLFKGGGWLETVRATLPSELPEDRANSGYGGQKQWFEV